MAQISFGIFREKYERKSGHKYAKKTTKWTKYVNLLNKNCTNGLNMLT